MVGGGIIGYACLGLFLSDTADKKRLREALPKIRVVEDWVLDGEKGDGRGREEVVGEGLMDGREV
jgi:hypothetical protein